MAAGGGTKAIIAAFIANLGIAVAKFFGFVITGASSMLAEAVHSTADAANQGLLLLGGKRAARAATHDHPFGYGRERYFWSFVVAVVLFSLGSVFAIYEGIHKLQHPEPLESAIVAVVILSFAILLEAWSLNTAVTESRRFKGTASWTHFIRRSKVPELPVVLLEDIGAMIGLVVALSSVLMAQFTGNPMWDGLGSVVIGLLLGVIALVLCYEMKSLLIGESATYSYHSAIRAAIEASPLVERLIHFRTQHIGPEEILLGGKIAFRPDLTVEQLAGAVDDVEHRVRAAVPAARIIYLEPDLYRPQAPAPEQAWAQQPPPVQQQVWAQQPVPGAAPLPAPVYQQPGPGAPS